MKKILPHVAWLLIAVMSLGVSTSVTPAYAGSLRNVLEQTMPDSAGNGFFSILLGLTAGNFLDKLLNGIPRGDTLSNNLQGLPSGQSTEMKEIIGFYAEWWGTDNSSFEAMSRHVNSIKTIAPFWATLQEDGSILDRGGNDHQSVVNFAHQNGLSVLLLVNNAKENSNGTPIHKILSNPTLRAKAIDNLEAYIKKYSLDGINIDFEMVDAGDRQNLNDFMRELSNRLKPQGYVVTIDVFPKQDEANDVAYAYDYAELSKYADKVIIMTYDQHGEWSGPGPIANVGWVEANLKFALKHIPKQKLYLGLAAYGYDWSTNGVTSLDYNAVTEIAKRYNAVTKWDDSAKAPYFSYTDQKGVVHQVWFENSKSLEFKLDLVNKYDIAGVAMWKLGEEDPAYWQVFKDKLHLK